MLKKQRNCITIISPILLACLSVPPCYSQDSALVFSSKRPIQINYFGCNTPKPAHLVNMGDSSSEITWRWDNKINEWCGWDTTNLPTSNLSNFLRGSLSIKFAMIEGDNNNIAEVKFTNFDSKSSKIINFRGFTNGDPSTGATATIPLHMFFDDGFGGYLIDPKSVRALQFDAPYSSNKGYLKIYSVELIP